MDWFLARIHLARAACPALTGLGCARAQCLTLGRKGSAFVHSDGDLPGWELAGTCNRGAFYRLPDSSSAGCPLSDLPPEVQVLGAELARDGVRADFLLPDAAAFRALLARFTTTGQDPRILRFGRGQGPMTRPKVILGLDTLTERQMEALQLATSLGYFREGSEGSVAAVASRMGCSRSTAHEHLQKGLDRLLRDAFGASDAPS